MASPKNWQRSKYKEENHPTDFVWTHTKNENIEVRVESHMPVNPNRSVTYDDPEHYDVVIRRMLSERRVLKPNFETKEQARKTAVEWMRGHPNP